MHRCCIAIHKEKERGDEMSKKVNRIRLAIIASILGTALYPTTSFADATTQNQKSSVTVTDSGVTQLVDPENPGNVVNPGESPSTRGALRIDFAPTLNFSAVPIKNKLRTYYALAQQFFDDTTPRGSYFQITDRREKPTGWSIQVKQTSQFHNDSIKAASERELKGAVLTLDKGWANSLNKKEQPTVTRDTIAIKSIGEAYTVATAKPGEGKGVWTVAFGASESNQDGQKNTLTPQMNERGEPIMDPVHKNKQAYNNEAIQLTIPDGVTIHPVEYQMELTWLIGQLP